MEITDGKKTRVVHANQVRHRQVSNDTSGNHPLDQKTHQTHQSWEAPSVDHLEIPTITHPQYMQGIMPQRDDAREVPDQEKDPVDIQAMPRRYPDQNRHPPERYAMGTSSGRASN